MKKISANEELIIKPFDFHSNTEVNLDGTDEIELYDNMIETIIERIAALQTKESGWRFHSVIKLEFYIP